jgi:group I intron endonuclease
MSIYSIYCATCIDTGKSYYGFDSAWPKRIGDHKRESKKKTNNTKFYNAIRKYGWDNFIWTLVYQSKEDVEVKDSHTLNIMEPHFIKENDTLINGYNMTPGGEGKRKGSTESLETKRKKSLSHTGKKLSKEHIQNSVNGRKGYKHSGETIEKLRNAKLGKSPWNKGQHTGQIPWNKKTTLRKCCCIVCNKEVDYANLGRHHKHLPKTLP